MQVLNAPLGVAMRPTGKRECSFVVDPPELASSDKQIGIARPTIVILDEGVEGDDR